MINPFEPTHAILAWHPTDWASRAVIYEGSVAACEKHLRVLREIPRERFPSYWRGALVEIRPIQFVEGVYRALIDELGTEAPAGEPIQ